MVGIFAVRTSTAHAETVDVKYRGPVDLAKFECQGTISTLVNRVCYNAEHQYMLILLKATWYHYCEIDAGTVGKLSKFYNARIKHSSTGGKFGCRDKVVLEL
ncbi:KTSC domain-containing protein [Rhizobium sp. TH2]|nr:KTSC domain-containing protein [Rhizobium sp. TH2]